MHYSITVDIRIDSQLGTIFILKHSQKKNKCMCAWKALLGCPWALTQHILRVRKAALSAHTPPILGKRAGGGSDRAGELVTPWCSSPLLYPPLARNKMACNHWDNSTSQYLTQPREPHYIDRNLKMKKGSVTSKTKEQDQKLVIGNLNNNTGV